MNSESGIVPEKVNEAELPKVEISSENSTILRKWSWGAFFLSFIWAFGSRLYGKGILIFLALFIPVVNLAVIVYFGVKGRQIAWNSGKWESIEIFEKRQKLLDALGIILFFVAGILQVIKIMGTF